MKVRLAEIPPDGLEIKDEIDPTGLDLDYPRLDLSRPVIVQFRLELMEDTVFVSGDANVPVSLECVRCLREFLMTLRPSFRVTLRPQMETSQNNPGEYHELHRDEMEENSYSGEEIDLNELFREQLLLAAPSYPLCRMDCRGLCPHCGADRNHDSCRCTEEDVGSASSKFQESLKKIVKKINL